MIYKFLNNDNNYFTSLNEDGIYLNKYYNEMINAYNDWNSNNFEYDYFIKLLPLIIKYHELVISKLHHYRISIYNKKYQEDFINFLELFFKILNYPEVQKLVKLKNKSFKICNDYPQLYEILTNYKITYEKY